MSDRAVAAPEHSRLNGRGLLRLPAFTRRAATAVGIAVAATLVLFVLWRAREVFLLAFGGVVLAVGLRGLSEWVCEHTPLPSGWSLGVVLVTVVGALAAAISLRGPAVADQVNVLRETLPHALGALANQLERYRWGQAIVAELQPLLSNVDGDASGMLSRARALATTMLATLAKLLIIVITGIYLAAEPRWYARGVVALVPLGARDRARTVLHELGRTLRSWLLVRVVSMVFVGVITGVGLWLLGVPLVFTLGLLVALLDLVPNFGPIVAAVPGVMLAFLQGPRQALYVALLYFGVQALGAYVLTPVLERRTVALPPALVLTTQAVLGVLAGVVGLAFAAPVTLVALVLVRMLYVGDVLGDAEAADVSTGEAPSQAGAPPLPGRLAHARLRTHANANVSRAVGAGARMSANPEGPPLRRREFLKILGVTGTAAVTVGCSTQDVERLIPYTVSPDNVVPGVSTYFATTYGECSLGCGVLAEVRDGRTIKLEGTPGTP